MSTELLKHLNKEEFENNLRSYILGVSQKEFILGNKTLSSRLEYYRNKIPETKVQELEQELEIESGSNNFKELYDLMRYLDELASAPDKRSYYTRLIKEKENLGTIISRIRDYVLIINDGYRAHAHTVVVMDLVELVIDKIIKLVKISEADLFHLSYLAQQLKLLHSEVKEKKVPAIQATQLSKKGDIDPSIEQKLYELYLNLMMISPSLNLNLIVTQIRSLQEKLSAKPLGQNSPTTTDLQLGILTNYNPFLVNAGESFFAKEQFYAVDDRSYMSSFAIVMQASMMQIFSANDCIKNYILLQIVRFLGIYEEVSTDILTNHDHTISPIDISHYRQICFVIDQLKSKKENSFINPYLKLIAQLQNKIDRNILTSQERENRHKTFDLEQEAKTKYSSDSLERISSIYDYMQSQVTIIKGADYSSTQQMIAFYCLYKTFEDISNITKSKLTSADGDREAAIKNYLDARDLVISVILFSPIKYINEKDLTIFNSLSQIFKTNEIEIFKLIDPTIVIKLALEEQEPRKKYFYLSYLQHSDLTEQAQNIILEYLKSLLEPQDLEPILEILKYTDKPPLINQIKIINAYLFFRYALTYMNKYYTEYPLGILYQPKEDAGQNPYAYNSASRAYLTTEAALQNFRDVVQDIIGEPTADNILAHKNLSLLTIKFNLINLYTRLANDKAEPSAIFQDICKGFTNYKDEIYIDDQLIKEINQLIESYIKAYKDKAEYDYYDYKMSILIGLALTPVSAKIYCADLFDNMMEFRKCKRSIQRFGEIFDNILKIFYTSNLQSPIVDEEVIMKIRALRNVYKILYNSKDSDLNSAENILTIKCSPCKDLESFTTLLSVIVSSSQGYITNFAFKESYSQVLTKTMQDYKKLGDDIENTTPENRSYIAELVKYIIAENLLRISEQDTQRMLALVESKSSSQNPTGNKKKKPKAAAEPEQPKAAAEPEQPKAAAKPEQPKASAEPKQPKAFAEPKQPKASAEPEQPKASAEPEQPKASAKPEQPKASAKPEQPKAAAKPEQPKAAAKPKQPKAAAKPKQPKASAEPEQPKADSTLREPLSYAAIAGRNKIS